ncbi:anthrax toxin receptor 1-like [Octodon degus]|uniref:Anthrax toxin receptor 1-like n=1 Tax=Octodon degus TaxID=10160 RepID=A0A6P6DB14_OCTDE|nr:anthrax toxin receptor 1-like [Octodon degus]
MCRGLLGGCSGHCNSQSPHHRERRNIWTPEDEDVLQYCDGVFDIYFVFDASKTTLDWDMLCSCWEDMVEKYLNPRVRMSFIVFSTKATVKMYLTSDRFRISYQLQRLMQTPVAGEANLHEGLKEANDQIAGANFGAARVSSMIIALLSGPLTPDALNQTMVEVERARRMGTYMYSVGIYGSDAFQLAAIADSPEHMFRVRGTPTDLHAVVDNIGTSACLELRAVQPSPLCTSES